MSAKLPGFASVAIDRPMPEPLTYAIPEALRGTIAPGVLVHVPFGSTKEVGIVTAVHTARPDGDFKLRNIEGIASPGYTLSEELRELAGWISEYYFCPPGEALSTASFLGFSDTPLALRTIYRLAENWRELELLAKSYTIVAEAEERLVGQVFESRAALARALGKGTSAVERLIGLGVFVAETEQPRSAYSSPATQLDLMPEQVAALEPILDAVRAPKFQSFLLFGVTGSGKTEVYLQAIAEAMARGGTALCLVPEIGLTPQTVGRFEARFAQPVGVFHSQLTRREKRVLYEHIIAGRIRLVIGARSAVFAPLPNLGIIVVDEEHETSYKQGESPRYHARDVALVRAQRLGIPVVMGSATPSMESFENCRRGKGTLLELKERAGGGVLPPVHVVDLAKAVRVNPGAGLISTELRDAIALRLERGEQSLLLLNRRGFSNFLFCPSCKWVARCEEDDVSLTVHRRRSPTGEVDEQLDLLRVLSDPSKGMLRCHFCSHSEPIPAICPGCQKEGLMAVGSGTQRIEEELTASFPAARVLRMDLDTIGGRQGFLRAWNEMVSGEAQIILGTQMIAKGLHLEGVTLVGAVLADVGLFLPDFRSEERTFFLLSQVAGRSGRSQPGEVIFQTFLPNHTAVQFATKHDYPGFFEHEMKRRRAWRFPPVAKLVALTISDEDQSRARETAVLLAGILRRLVMGGGYTGAAIRGPLPAPLKRLANRWRERILLRGDTQGPLHNVLRAALADRAWRLPSSARLAIDVDPMDLL
jgi:primosomal protein N' (replication factor Y)